MRLEAIATAVAGACALASCGTTGRPTTAAAAANPASTTGSDAFRAQPPEPEPHDPFVVPVPGTSVLSNGMRLWAIERPTARGFAATLVVRGGAATFPREPANVFRFMAASMKSGTDARNEEEISAQMNEGFISLTASHDDASLRLSVKASRESFDQALGTMADIALRPAFPVGRIELLRTRYLALAARDPEEMMSVARRNLFGALFGRGHPYAPTTRDIAATGAIQRSDVVRAWRESMDPAAATLIVVGPFETKALGARVQSLFGGWTRDPAAAAPAAPQPPSPGNARLIVIDRPRSAQALVLYGSTIAPVQSPQHLADFVAHELIRGRSSTPTAAKVRAAGNNAPGETYQNIDRGGGISWWQASVTPDQAAPLLSALEARVRDLRDHGPTTGELAEVKDGLASAQPRALETSPGLADSYAESAAHDLPPDHQATLHARLDAITPAAVKARVPDPSTMTAVVVGDLSVLRAPLLGLGWGPTEVHDKDGTVLGTLSNLRKRE
ncbi:MAG TPA: insulinase family protein [Polyangia bacterium]|nr:insulinase family protein [Polyangia bacterium]